MKNAYVAALRATALVGLAALGAACSSSEGKFAVCGVSSAITAPDGPRGHAVVTRDSLWRERLVQEVAAVRADTTVRVLLVHATAVGTADREFVTARGGTIVEEHDEWNGIVGGFTVEALRAFAPQASTTRIIDAHLVSERVLPPCD